METTHEVRGLMFRTITNTTVCSRTCRWAGSAQPPGPNATFPGHVSHRQRDIMAVGEEEWDKARSLSQLSSSVKLHSLGSRPGSRHCTCQS